MNFSPIKSFWRNILFSIPHVKVIYKLLTLGYEVKTIKNFEEPISFFVPSGDYSGIGNLGIDKKGVRATVK